MPENIQFIDPDSAIAAIGEQIGIWRWDPSHNVSQWSAYLFRLLGLEPSDTGKPYEFFEDLLHPDDRQRVKEALDSFYEDGIPYRVEIRMRHQQGHYVHLITQGYFEDLDGTDSDVLIGTAVDVTAEVWAREFAAKQAGLIHAMAQNIPGALFRFRLDPDGTSSIEFMSGRSSDIWELSPEEIHGDASKLMAMIHEDDFASKVAALDESGRNLTPLFCEWRITTPSGKEKHLLGRGIPEKHADGAIIWNNLVLDVTDEVAARKRIAEQELRIARFEKAESIVRLSGGIAHDFNNLLAIIMGNAELIPRLKDGEQHEAIAEEIIDACRRGSKLTEHLLAFARQSDLEARVIDPRALFGKVSSLLARVMPQMVDISFDIAPDLWPLKIDEALLETAIVNLCVNSRDAMPGGGSLTVRATNVTVEGLPDGWQTSGLVPGDYIKIEVSDSGTGIPEEHLDKVTEPFFTTKGPDRGSGLGLAMVQGLVEQANGLFLIHSTIDEGTSIELFLPARPDDTVTEGDASELGSRGGWEKPETYSIAIVEDEDAILRTLQRQLGLDGHRVVGFRDGPSFLDYAMGTEEPLDFLLTDLGLPGPIQGLDLALKLKEISPQTKVIVLSGYDAKEDSALNVAVEGFVFLRKPVSYESLLQCIENLQRQA